MSAVNAGSQLSGDVLVEIRSSSSVSVRVISPLGDQAERLIRELVNETLTQRGIDNVRIKILDNAASEWAVRARLATAFRRWREQGAPHD
ncbi:MAG: hypothetical protein ACFN04_01560 [Propionibacterium acidifaciens]|uniref:citrate lyase acyl carrier protein n=2 Tax=Propionibacterium acidifaciens TaxID=556499 RepID=UPI00040FF97C